MPTLNDLNAEILRLRERVHTLANSRQEDVLHLEEVGENLDNLEKRVTVITSAVAHMENDHQTLKRRVDGVSGESKSLGSILSTIKRHEDDISDIQEMLMGPKPGREGGLRAEFRGNIRRLNLQTTLLGILLITKVGEWLGLLDVVKGIIGKQ